MICNTIGLTSDSFETLYVRGGAEVPEVYGSINYAQPIFYSLKTLTGATSYSFMGYSEPLKSYEIDGNMVQSGAPTPTSTIYPQECGDRTENLFDKENSSMRYSGYINSIDGKVTPSTSGSLSIIVPVKPNSNYTISKLATTRFRVGLFTTYPVEGSVPTASYGDRDGEGIDRGTTLSLPTSADTAYIMAFIKNYNDTVTTEEMLSSVMVNEGSTALPYEPYGQYKIPLNLNGTTQNIYLSEPLRKIGDYADSISSDGTVTRRIKKLVLTGDEDWRLAGELAGQTIYAYLDIYNSANMAILNAGICTHLPITTISAANTNEGFGVQNRDNNTKTAILMRHSGFDLSSVDNFKVYLTQQYANGTPVTIWYVLSVPITEQVTAPTLTPAAGNNTLAINTALQPSSVSITGHVKPSG